MEENNQNQKYTSGWKFLWELFLLLAGCGVAMFILVKLFDFIF